MSRGYPGVPGSSGNAISAGSSPVGRMPPTAVNLQGGGMVGQGGGPGGAGGGPTGGPKKAGAATPGTIGYPPSHVQHMPVGYPPTGPNSRGGYQSPMNSSGYMAHSSHMQSSPMGPGSAAAAAAAKKTASPSPGPSAAKMPSARPRAPGLPVSSPVAEDPNRIDEPSPRGSAAKRKRPQSYGTGGNGEEEDDGTEGRRTRSRRGTPATYGDEYYYDEEDFDDGADGEPKRKKRKTPAKSKR